MTKPTGIVLAAGAAAGGLLAAAFLPMAVAFADDDIGFVPVDDTFVPTGVSGMPPSSADVITGQEEWIGYDFTTKELNPDQSFSGVDTETITGSWTNNDFAASPLAIDLLTFNDGWAVEWVDITENPVVGNAADVGELLITPLGDVPLMGTFF